MTHAPRRNRLAVGALTRVEGEGGLDIDIVDGALAEVRLRIFEPPRFFEGFLRGRAFTEPPDITARICGICPIAYQMSACQAIEAACGAVIDPPLRELRHLLYCGEWIESHALHVHLLHAPDFLGYESGIAMAADHRPEVERGLRLKQIGNEIVEVVGGRAVHPINVRIGGFWSLPDRHRMTGLAESLRWACDAAEEIVRWTAGLPMPDHVLPADVPLVALRHASEYPMLGDRLVSTTGLDLGVDEYPAWFLEEQVEHSTALHSRIRRPGDLGDDGVEADDLVGYLVGPLARFALNADHLAPRAAAVALEVGLTAAERNPFRSIVVRSIEVLHACETALAIVGRYDAPERAAVPVAPRPGSGCGWSEAPRGLLWHRYELDADGLVVDARIVPPTSQNQPTIEHDPQHLIEERLGGTTTDDELRALCEQAVRSYDPCISCATHFMDVRVHRS